MDANLKNNPRVPPLRRNELTDLREEYINQGILHKSNPMKENLPKTFNINVLVKRSSVVTNSIIVNKTSGFIPSTLYTSM